MLKTYTIKFVAFFSLLLNYQIAFASNSFLNASVSDTLLVQSDPATNKLTAVAEIWMEATDQQITACNLIIGKEYKIAVQQAYRELNCNPSVAFPVLSSQLNKKQLASSSVLSFTASAECMNFELYSDCKNNIPLDVLVLGKNNNSVNSMLPPNLVVDQLYTYAELIEEIFIGGGCFDVSNINLIGNIQGVGHFTSGSSSINIEEGVILASGSIYNAPGPNSVTNVSTNFSDFSGDPDLDILASNTIRDAVGIEFDFTPTVGQISFDYVFASDEYCDYVNSQFNDVFGFFISGPGISGGFTGNAENIALIPGTSNNVSINNVNIQNNSAYYVDNVPLGQPQFGSFPCTQDLAQQGMAINDCEYDGFTTVLTAVANVIPCETYHIRLVVADVGDGIFDSAVFLAANSFDAGGAATVDSDVPGVEGGIAYEGCVDGYFIFERVDDSDLSEDLTINFTISSSSTATAGVDYAALPTSITIPAGATQVLLPITVFDDLIVEGTESIILELELPCDCTSPFGEFFIQDLLPLQVTPADYSLCYADLVELTPFVSGGAPYYSYEWDTGETSETLSVIPSGAGTTLHTVTVTDACGTTEENTFTVTVIEEPIATISGNAQICAGNTNAELTIDFTGIGPWEIMYTINGVPQLPITVNTNPYTLVTTSLGTYQLISVSASGCPGIPEGVGTVNETDIQLSSVVNDVICANETNGNINLTVNGGQAPYTYQWNNNLGTNEDPGNLSAGTYVVTVTDTNGCLEIDSFVVDALNVTILSLTSTQDILCHGAGNGTIDVEVSGGNDPYVYIWDNGVTDQDQSGLDSGDYSLTVTDNEGCSHELSVTIDEPDTLIASGVELSGVDCLNPIGGSIDLTVNGGIAPYTFIWSNLSTEEDIDTLISGDYTVTISDFNNCTTSTVVTVNSDTDLPMPDATASGDLNCDQQMITLDGSNSNGTGSLAFEWQNSLGDSLGASPTLDVSTVGTYTMVVTNTTNGCSSQIDIPVAQDTVAPIAQADPLGILTCSNLNVTLDGQASTNASGYEWFAEDGSPLGTGATIDVSNIGDYTLVVTNGTNGCTAETMVSVDENIVLPVADALPLGILTCDSTLVTLDGTGSIGQGTLLYEWTDASGIPISMNSTAIVGNAGSYNLLVTDMLNGCTQEVSVNVTEDISEPIANAGPDGILSCDIEEIMLDGSASSTGGNIAYTWLNGGGVELGNTPEVSISESGTYTLIVENTANGCTISDDVVITPDMDLPLADAGDGGVIDCNQSLVSLNGSNSSSGTGISYQWINEDGVILTNDLMVDVSDPGTYTLIVSNASNGCDASSSVEVTEDFLEPVPVASPDGILTCIDGLVNLSGEDSAGTGTISYQWLDEANTEIGTTSTIEVNATGTYGLIITDSANGCTAETTVTVNENFEEPNPNILGGDLINCDILQSVLNGASSSGIGSLTYQWLDQDNVEIGLVPIVEVNQAGIYTMIITDAANGCTAMETVEVMADVTPPIVDPGLGGTVDCIVEDIVLGGSNTSTGTNFNYSWQDEALTLLGTDYNLTVSSEGVYTLVVTNTDNGCTADASVTVDENIDFPIAIAGDDDVLTCDVSSLTLIGSNSSSGSNINYSWLNDLGVEIGTTADLVVSETGTFVLVVSDAENGCVATDEIIITPDTDLPIVDAGLGDTLNCNVTTVTLNGENSSSGNNYSYEWLDADNISIGLGTSVDVSNPGNYTLVVENEDNGCSASATVAVGENIEVPIADAGPDGLLNCEIDLVTLDGTNSSISNGALSYEWRNENNEVIGVEEQLESNTPGNYTLIITAENGCTAMSPVAITADHELPIVDPGTPGTLDCVTPEWTLGGPNTSIGTDINYQWLDGNNVEVGNTANITVSNAGNYTLLVTNSLNQCSAEASIVLDDNFDYPIADPAPGATLTCDNTSHLLSLGNTTQGTNINYTWTNSLGQNIGSGDNISVNTADVYTLVVSNTDNSCSSSAEVIVVEDVEVPIADAGPDGLLNCEIDLVTLDATNSSISNGTLSYEWRDENNEVVGVEEQLELNTPGNYSLLITAENGCTAMSSAIVTADHELPIVDPGTPGTLDCVTPEWMLGGPNTSIGTDINYQWLDSNNVEVGNTANIIVSNAGNYTLLVSNSLNQCSAEASIVLDEDFDYPIADPAPGTTLTCDNTNHLLSLANTTQGSNISYAWTNSLGQNIGNTDSVLITTPDVYTLVVSNTDNSCSSTAEVVVAENVELPIADAGPDATLDCNAVNVNLNATNSSISFGTLSYEWLDANNLSIGNAAQIDVLSAGIYTVIVTAENGCTEAANVEVMQDINAPIVDAGEPGILNCAISSWDLGGTNTSTGTNITYEWLDQDDLVIANTATISVSDTGLYTLVVYDNTNNCASSETIAVTENTENPIADPGVNDVLNCNQSSILLGGSTTSVGSDINYQWLAENGDVLGIEMNLSTSIPGIYTLHVLNSTNECDAMATVEITEDIATPIADAGEGGVLTCDVTDYELDGSNSSAGAVFEYEWKNEAGAIISDQLNTTVSEAGNYTLIVYNMQNGCSSTADVTVVPDANLPTANAGNGGVLNCNISTVNLNGNASSTISGDISYEWKNEGGLSIGAASDVDVQTPGLYTLIITDGSNGCSATAVVEVSEDLENPIVNAGETDTLTCTLNNIDLQGTATGNGVLNYEWFNAQANSIGNQAAVTISTAGVYTLIVTNTENQCTGSDVVEVVPDDNLPVAVAGAGATLNCVVESVVLDGSASSAGTNITYEWLDAQGGFLTDQNTITVTTAGNYTLVVTDVDNNCSTMDEVLVIQDIEAPIPVIDPTSPLLNCDVSSIVLDASGSQPFGNLNFEWSTATGSFLSGQLSSNPEVNATGIYDLLITNTENGCTSIDDITIEEDVALPMIDIANPPILNCYESNINLNASNSSTGAFFDYNWTTTTGGIVSGETGLTPIVNQAGSYTLLITNTANACTQTASITVIEDIETPIAEAGEGGELNCTITEIDLDGTGSSSGAIYGYLWSTTNGSILNGNTSLYPEVNAAGLYELKVTNVENGCVEIDEVMITENTNLPTDAEAIPHPPICFGEYGSIEIVTVEGGTGPYLYSVNGGQSFYADSIFYNLASGVHDYIIQDVFGCEYESSIVIPTVDEVTVYIEPEVFLELGDSLQLFPEISIPESEIDTIIWTPTTGLSCTNCLYPYAKPLETTRYTIRVINHNGCDDSDDILLRVNRPDGIYIPNAFSPDNDGQNDEFMIYANDQSVARIKKFEVFDRWGELVFSDFDFQPNDPAHSWDGRFRGELMNPAVFVYWAEVEYIDGTTILYEGDVTLVK